MQRRLTGLLWVLEQKVADAAAWAYRKVKNACTSLCGAARDMWDNDWYQKN